MNIMQQTLSTFVFLIAICLASVSLALSPQTAKQIGQKYDNIIMQQTYLIGCSPEAEGGTEWMDMQRKVYTQQASLTDAIRYYNSGYSMAQIQSILKARAQTVHAKAQAVLAQQGCDSLYIQREIREVAPQYVKAPTLQQFAASY